MVSDKQNYYQILGLDSTASEHDVKLAYKKLAVKTHPDKHSGSVQAEEKFKLLTEAYQVLSDTNQRQTYDSSLSKESVKRASSTGLSSSKKDTNVLIYEAAREGSVPNIVAGFKSGGRVQWRNPTDDGRTALHVAASHGQVEAMLMLISLGSDPQARNLYQDTPLHESCATGMSAAALALLRNGAPVGLVNKYGATGADCGRRAPAGDVCVLTRSAARPRARCWLLLLQGRIHPASRLDCADSSSGSHCTLPATYASFNTMRYKGRDSASWG